MAETRLTASEDLAPFHEAPWRTIRLRDWPAAAAVPTMLAREERKFYLWAARDWTRGDGAIVDLGAFVGGSTAWLAAGHAAAGHAGRVHAYDKFTVDPRTKRTHLYAKGVTPFEGCNSLSLAHGHLSPWRQRVTLHRGPIERLGWSGGPIEVLAVDAFKKAHLMDRMVLDFFPSLIPGRSLIIQQDFLHWSQPWIAALMLRLGDAVRPLAHIRDDTLVYLVQKPLHSRHLADLKLSDITDAELQTAIAETRARFGPGNWGIDTRLRQMAAGLAANPGVRVAWKMKKPDFAEHCG